MHAMNVTYDIKEERPDWKKFSLSLPYTLLLAVMLLSAAAMMLPGLTVAQFIAGQVGLGQLAVTLWTWLRIPVAVLIIIAALAAIYCLFPQTPSAVPLGHTGAILAVVV